MSLKIKLTSYKLGGAIGFLLVLAIGLAMLHLNFRVGKTLIRSSYDWSFDLNPFHRALRKSDVVIVYLDEDSHKKLSQPFNQPWDRALHAQLLRRLTADGAKAVVFDIIFSDPGPNPRADQELIQAIKAHGRVILAADYVSAAQAVSAGESTVLTTLTLPFEPFREAAAGWGVAQLQPDEDFIVRQHYHGPLDDRVLSLSWATTKMLGLDVTKDPSQRLAERWINYYGGPETVPHVSYSQALHPDGVSPGFFRDKIVIVGARPITGFFIERRDELRSSYRSWSEKFLFMPAVEVHATELLNLVRADWLNRLSPATELGTVLFAALLFGCTLLRFRPLPAAGLALAGMLVVTFLATLLFGRYRLWFPWMIVVVAQIPLALVWAVIFRSIEWYVQKRKMEQERQHAESRIREQAALLDKAQDAIMVYDLDWNVLYWNKSAERLFGWTAEEVRQINPNESFFKLDSDKFTEAFEAVLDKGEWIGELRQPTKTGTGVSVESRWTLVRDDTGTPKSILVINTNITEKKLLEAQFLRAQRLESIGTLAGGIAHDLNNVLSPIIMGVGLLQMRAQDERSQNMLKTIEASAQRGADMVKQVLTFARGQAGERTVLQLSHLIREMQKITRETFPKSIQVNTRINPNLWLVSADATQLHQILLNLCVNARDAMPEGGEILIAAENETLTEAAARRFVGAKPGNYVTLAVSDNGSGIPPKIIDKIFEPFFTTKEVGKGTGLGLSTVISIVKGHEGFLDLKSELGKGTTFKIYLPATEVAEEPAAAAPDKEQFKGGGEWVLLVDDEKAIRDTIKSTLVEGGYQVLTAHHGAEAFALCSQQKARISLAIVDMMMPVMDGPKTIKALRKLNPDLRFIAISGLPQSDQVKEQLGRDVTFLNKPFTTDKLLGTLRQVSRGELESKTSGSVVATALLRPLYD